MESAQRTARIAGLWFIGTFVFSIPALLFYDSVLNEDDYILGSRFDRTVSVGALLEIGLAIANIATAVVLFPILKRVNEAVLVGLIGGPLAFLGGVLILFGVFDNPSAGSFVFTVPEIVWESFLCIYLTFWGFRRSSPLLRDERRA